MKDGSDPAPIEPVLQLSLPPVRPTRSWYWLAVALVATGLVGGFILLAVGSFGYLEAIEDLERVDLPGRAEIRATGAVRLYHEPEGGEVVSLADLQLHVEDRGGELLVVPGIAAAGERYEVDDRSGVMVAELDLPEPGPSVIVAEGEAPGRLAVGRSPGRHLKAYGLGALAVAVVGVAAGVVAALTIRRRRASSLAARLDASRRVGADTA